MGRKKRTPEKDTYIFLTGAIVIKNTGQDSWIASIKDIKQQHKLTGKDLQDLIDNLEEEDE